MTADRLIVFDNVSKFYGEVLGVNRVTLSLPPGVTSIVGPNGSGKTTLMNLMTGLVRPTRGRISVLGMDPGDPEAWGRKVGYCTQFDSFPRGATGRSFVRGWLRLHGFIPPKLEDAFPALFAHPLASFLAYLVVIDFVMYWLHRAQHQFG